MAQDDKIKAWIDAARAKGATDEEIKAVLNPEDQAKYFKPQKAGLKGTGATSDPGFLGEMYNKFIDPVVKTAEELPGVLGGSSQFGKGRTAAGPIPDYIWSKLKGMTEQAQAQQAQGKQEGGLLGLTRQTLGGVPGLGPASMDVIDAIRKGQWGKSGADMLSVASMFGGPKAMEGAGAPIRAVGRDLYEDALHLPPGMRNPRPEDLLQLGKSQRITFDKGGLVKLKGIIDDAMAKAQAEVAKNPNLPVSTQKVLQDIESEYQGYHASGDEDLPQATKLMDIYDKYIDHFGNSVSLQKAQELKKATWGRLNEKTFQQEAAQTPGLQRALFLRGTGLKKAIEDAVGGPQSDLAQANQLAHNAMGLQQQIQTLDAKSMNAFVKALPFITGAGAYALAKTLGAPGGETLALGGAVSSAGLASYMSRLAVSDPAVMSRLGLFMSEAGKGNAAQFVANLPKAAVLPTTGGDTQGKGPQETGAQPEATNTPPQMMDIPMMIREASKAEGIDPQLALAVANQESGQHHIDPSTGAIVTSPKGALGVFQLMPDTAQRLGVDPRDQQQNIKGGVKLLGQLLDQYDGDKEKALAAYNSSPSAVAKYGGVPPFPETQNYVKSIMKSLGEGSDQ